MKIKKVLFIRSSYYADNGQLVKATKISDRITAKNLAELAIPLLAAYTPSHIHVEMIDDCLQEIDFNSDADIIAISCWLIHTERAIDLAKEFKKRGKIVVAGGHMPTMNPENIIGYVDAVCIGEGDLIWPQMIKDIENNCLKKSYKADFKMPLDQIPTPRYDLIKDSKIYALSSSYPVQATRGCPYACDYCSVITFYEKTYRYRPIKDILRDIKSHGKKQIHFVDDNLMENKKFAKELFVAMKGLKVRWGAQVTINIADDPELLKLAYEAGCRMTMVGIETINKNNLNYVSKSWADPKKYKEQIRKIQDAGIGVHALIVFGFPHDTKETFQDTVDFLIDSGAAAAEFFILTPYPKTPLGKQYLEEGRIFDKNLAHYREPYVVFKHDNLTPKELQDGYWQAFNQFYSLKNNFARLWKSNYNLKIFQLVANLYYWIKLKRKIVPTHFQRGNYSYSRFPKIDSCNPISQK